MNWQESELEDYAVSHLYELLGVYYVNPVDTLEIGLIGRQVKCRYGVIDLLVYSTVRDAPIPIFNIIAIELKAVAADRKAIEQVLRYRAALEEVGIYDALSSEEFFEYGASLDQFIAYEGMIVAPSFHDSTTWFPSRIIAQKTDGGFEFESDRRTKGDRRGNASLQTTMLPILGRVARSAKIWHLSQKLQRGTDSLNIDPPLN